MIKKVLSLLFLLALSLKSWAALGIVIGPVASLRIEGNVGFIGLSQSMASTANCGGRVWVDMTSALGRSIYATAMMAYSTKQSVAIRADDSGVRVFGECPLYDIVTQ